MWQAIRSNIRRSRLLIGLMGGVLVLLGAAVGASLSGAPEGGALGAVAALAVWLILVAVALLGGDRVILAGTRARRIEKQDAPRLWNVVEEMTIASGLGQMPRIYIVDDNMPNAFATGRNPETACVAVTSGLLKRLNRDELQGVIAHELAHIRNLDIRFMTVAGVMLGSIVIIADLYLRSVFYGAGRRRSSGNGQAQALIVVLALVMAVLAPIGAQLLYFACSRKREYLADASAARFTRYPQGLAAALEKISDHAAAHRKGVSRAVAPMYIVNPLQATSGSGGWLATHPPTAKRVEILRGMGGNAGWGDYEAAYRRITGATEPCLDRETLASESSVAARGPSSEATSRQDAVQRGREVADVLDRLAEFLLITCACGVRIKLPPDFAAAQVNCTRCGREHQIRKRRESG
jgi:heat shock protein HtpX